MLDFLRLLFGASVLWIFAVIISPWFQFEDV